MERYKDAEDYALFEFGDPLHDPHDTGSTADPFIWIGIDVNDNQVWCLTKNKFHDGQWHKTWMHHLIPYWHRASHCPLKKEE